MKIRSIALAFCALLAAMLMAAPTVQAAVIVNDSWADGDRANGADPLDSNWWASSSTNGIEVSTGSLGMVTGTSGRGIHTVFPTQTLANVGDKLVATYTFTTPATVGSGGSGAFRVGLFDTLGRGMHPDTPGHAFVLLDKTGRVVWQRDYWLAPYRTMYVEPSKLLDDLRAALEKTKQADKGARRDLSSENEHRSPVGAST